MSVLTMPQPQGWQSGQRRWGWAAVGLLVISVWWVYHGIQATLRGHYLTTVVVVGLVGPFALLIAALARQSIWPPSLRARVDSTGTALRPDIWMGALMLVGGLVAIPGAVVAVIFIPRGEIDIPMSRGMQIFSPILMVCALLVLIPGLITAFRRRGAGYVKLTPYQVEYADIKVTRSVAWDDIDALTDHIEGENSRKPVVLQQRDGSDFVVERLDLYVAGGAPLYWMIRHYWLHPDDRVELVDGRALERLKAGRFEVDDAGASQA
jgi:hypothetical protein